MSVAQSAGLKWTESFTGFCGDLRNPSEAPVRQKAREKAWLLLNSAISEYLRFHTRRLGSASREDLEDIAADKSLDLLRKIELKVWDPTARSPSEITGFLSKVARNGLVDKLREEGRRVEIATEEQPEWDPDLSVLETPDDTRRPPDPASNLLESKEIARVLRQCTEELDPRSRLVWFLRVFCQLSSKETAVHPQVSLRSSHVDVILHRARNSLRECLLSKGCEPGDLPPGTFVELWEVCRLDDALVEAGVRR